MNSSFIHNVRLWYTKQDERYKVFFSYTLKVLVCYLFFDWLITGYVGLVTPGGSFESSYLMYVNVLPALVNTIVWGTYFLLSALQFTVFVHGIVVGIVGTGGVEVGWYCIGYYAWMTISVLVSCYSGQWKVKIAYIGVSILLIHFLNILRISTLAILAQYNVDLENHHSIYNIVIYLFVGVLLLGYIEWFAEKGR